MIVKPISTVSELTAKYPEMLGEPGLLLQLTVAANKYGVLVYDYVALSPDNDLVKEVEQLAVCHELYMASDSGNVISEADAGGLSISKQASKRKGLNASPCGRLLRDLLSLYGVSLSGGLIYAV